jgi:hypothetical protein
MLRLLILLTAILVGTAVAQDPAPSETGALQPKPSSAQLKEKLKRVVQGQLEAFRQSDFVTAYGFAAKGIREQFPIEKFEAMVKENYAAIAQSTEAVFGLILDDGKVALVNVRIVGVNKESVNYRYVLEREGDEWRIGGVIAMRQNEAPAI